MFIMFYVRWFNIFGDIFYFGFIIVCYNMVMNDRELEQIKIKISNLMRLRDNCIGFIGLITGGVIGLLLSEINYLKISLIIIGVLGIIFLFVLTNEIDKDIDIKIKDITK